MAPVSRDAAWYHINRPTRYILPGDEPGELLRKPTFNISWLAKWPSVDLPCSNTNRPMEELAIESLLQINILKPAEKFHDPIRNFICFFRTPNILDFEYF